MQKIDLLLINPSNKKQMYGDLGSNLSGIEPPVWTGLVAAFIREKGFSVKIIDADAQNWTPEYTAEKVIEQNPLLVGIAAIGANPSASSTPKMEGTRRILNALEKRDISAKTLIFGIHASALPERTLQEENVDYVCRGECFFTILELLLKLNSTHKDEHHNIKGLWYTQKNKIVSGGWGELVKNLDTLPFIAWDLLPMDKYRAHNWHCFGNLSQRGHYTAIYTSLGCPFNCSYCNIHALYNGKPGIRFRSIKKVIEEIDLLVKNYGIKNIKILDELFVLNEKRVLELCDLLIQRAYNLNIWAYARVDTVNEKMLKMMKHAGINWLCFGIESGSKRVRDDVSKGKFSQEAIRKAMEITHKCGISIIGNFLFGLPEDNLETMQETLNLAKELNCEYVNFYATMAYPGAKLYEYALRNGIKLPDTWIGYSQFNEETVPLPTKYLSSAEVLSFRDKAFYDYYNDPAYLKMIENKFGLEAIEHIKEMLKYKIRRKLLEAVKAGEKL